MFVFLGLILGSCISTSSRQSTAEQIASNAGMESVLFQSGSFSVFGYQRLIDPNLPVQVYMEGDGLAFITASRPSSNPTPVDPVALRLAALDQSPNVLYLARPCQYVDLKTEPNCTRKYWTSHRFSEEIVESVSRAVQTVQSKHLNGFVNLIGYSGGGAVAVLVAARNNHVLSLRTLSGYLDHVNLNREKNVSQLHGSLDPLSVARKIQSIPQVHYAGSQDTVIPSWVAKSFLSHVENENCSSFNLVHVSHSKGWDKFWRENHLTIPQCEDTP